jgi:hypothetical protein
MAGRRDNRVLKLSLIGLRKINDEPVRVMYSLPITIQTAIKVVKQQIHYQVCLTKLN